jgi:hypothetical protein
MIDTPDLVPAPFDPALPPSASLLAYLHAEQVAPPARRGTPAPLAAVRVDTARLACALFAIAFWQLREAGLVSLEVVSERRLLRTREHLRVARTAGASGRRDGLEGGLLEVLTPGSRGTLTPAWEALPAWARRWAARVDRARADLAGRPDAPPLLAHAAPPAPPATVADAVARWYGSSVRNPERVSIAWTEREGVAKGYLAVVEVRRHPVAALFRGTTALAAERERVAALAAPCARLLAGWQTFQVAEAALADLLEREIAAGIDARREVPSDSGGGG